MSCSGEGATHSACECFLAENAKLREALEVAKKVLEGLSQFQFRNSFYGGLIGEEKKLSESISNPAKEALARIAEIVGEK